jgi:hypothetical protein
MYFSKTVSQPVWEVLDVVLEPSRAPDVTAIG